MPEQKSVQIKICGITGKVEIRWLNIVDSLCPRFSINTWCFSFHFS